MKKKGERGRTEKKLPGSSSEARGLSLGIAVYNPIMHWTTTQNTLLGSYFWKNEQVRHQAKEVHGLQRVGKQSVLSSIFVKVAEAINIFFFLGW